MEDASCVREDLKSGRWWLRGMVIAKAITVGGIK